MEFRLIVVFEEKLELYFETFLEDVRSQPLHNLDSTKGFYYDEMEGWRRILYFFRDFSWNLIFFF